MRLIYILLVSVMLACTVSVQAQTRALILGDSTSSGSNPYFQAAIAEMESALGAANVTAIGNLHVNNLTPSDLLDSDGNKYDIIVLTAVYEGLNTSNRALLQTAVQNRTANAFFLFPDQCSICAANVDNITLPLINAATGWSVTRGSGLTPLSQVNLNTNSPLHTSFLSLDPMVVRDYSALNNVPANNALYIRNGFPLPNEGMTLTNNVAAIIVPRAQSFGGAGACIFVISDVNVFTSPGNPPVGTLGATMVDAVAGSCSVDEGTISITKQLSLPAGISGPFEFNFTADCDQPAPNTIYGPVSLEFPTNTTVDIPFVPAGGTCSVVETLPAAPAGYVWGTPALDTVTVIADQVVSANAVNQLIPAASPPPASVPTLNWGMLIALSILLATFGGLYRRH